MVRDVGGVSSSRKASPFERPRGIRLDILRTGPSVALKVGRAAATGPNDSVADRSGTSSGPLPPGKGPSAVLYRTGRARGASKRLAASNGVRFSGRRGEQRRDRRRVREHPGGALRDSPSRRSVRFVAARACRHRRTFGRDGSGGTPRRSRRGRRKSSSRSIVRAFRSKRGRRTASRRNRPASPSPCRRGRGRPRR